MDTTYKTPPAGRREFLGAAGSLAAASLIGAVDATPSAAQTVTSGAPGPQVRGRRRLGKLEVSSIGIGV